jgi:hypothetical protein
MDVMNTDLAELIRKSPYLLRLMYILQIEYGGPSLKILVAVILSEPRQRVLNMEFVAHRPRDYCFRPMTRGRMVGGPALEVSNDDPLLHNPELQFRGGDDCEKFDPPLKLTLLRLDTSYVIGERFEVTGWHSRYGEEQIDLGFLEAGKGGAPGK